MNHFGEILKTFRESKGLRLKDVAKAGISTSQLSRFEKGETDLTISTFMLILNESNMPILMSLCMLSMIFIVTTQFKIVMD
ncbi:MutR family transcriptional regulator [Streptococcus pyogenes]|nr:MutR family transcriptional regulator [Streptococcus pyogenes]